MRKLIIAMLMACTTIATYAAKDGNADSSVNVLTVKVMPTKDLKRIPIQVSLSNELPITCVQCYLATPDTADLFLHESADSKNLVCTPADRWASHHQAMVSWGPKSDPHTAVALVASTSNQPFKGNDGPVFTVYFDGSNLGNGDHAVKMTKGNVAWTDMKKIKTFYTPDTEAAFTIKRGKVIAPKGGNKSK